MASKEDSGGSGVGGSTGSTVPVPPRKSKMVTYVIAVAVFVAVVALGQYFL